MLKKITLVGLFICCVNSLQSQEKETYAFNDVENSIPTSTMSSVQNNYDFQKHWSFGGNLGLSFWNGGTNILLGPKAYYNVSPIFLAGFGLSYMYSEFKSNITGYHSNSFGGSVMAAVRPIDFIQISAEYEGLQTNYSGYYSDEYFVNALYFGFSFVTGPVSFGVRYDVLYDLEKSIYSSPWNPFVGFYF